MSERIGTTCVQGGWRPGDGEPRQVPIYQNTTWKYDTSEHMGRLFDLEESGYFYTRLANPTNDAVAAKIAELEGGAAAMLTSSGQAANFFAVFNIADAVLVVSCLMFVIYVFFGSRGDDDEDDEPIKVRPMPRSTSADPVDDFADIFGISTKAAEQTAEAQPLKPEESKLPPTHDAFWDDFGPAQRTAAPKPAEKAPEAKPKSAADAGEDFSIEDILAEFKDL